MMLEGEGRARGEGGNKRGVSKEVGNTEYETVRKEEAG